MRIADNIGAMPEPTDLDPPVSRVHRQQDGFGSRTPLLAVFVLALIAIGLAAWALLRPPSHVSSEGNGVTYTDAQRAEGKTTICSAFDTVRKGVTLNTNLQAPGGEEVVGSLAVAANARLSLYDGGQYLIARLEPATTPELADAVRSFANNLMDIGAAATAGVVNAEPAQAARLRDADALNTTIVGLCQ
jgi:hypothetical protein